MTRNRVGDAMISVMSRDGFNSVCMLDGAMNDVALSVEPPLELWRGMNPHPLNRAKVAASYLARDDRFTVAHMHAHDSIGRPRRLRLFMLRKG